MMEEFRKQDKIPTRPPVEGVDQSKRNLVLGIPGVMLATAGGVLAGASAGMAIGERANQVTNGETRSGLSKELQRVVERLDPSGNVIKNALKSADNELVDASKKIEQLHEKASDAERSEEDIALLKIEAVILGNHIAELEIYRDTLQKRADESDTPALPEGESVRI